jgi:FMN-dependent NADH-azoreductase
MSKILLVTSSPRHDSLSTAIARETAAGLAASGGTITTRDVGLAPPAHIDDAFSTAIRKAPEDRSEAEASSVRLSDELVAELLSADTLVIGTGLINFGVYSGLKAWIDNIARAGLTFKYGESGPVGLVGAKKAYVVLASGGVYSSGAASALDHATTYLKTVLGFIGIADVEVIRVEGVAYGPDAAEQALSSARGRIAELAAA